MPCSTLLPTRRSSDLHQSDFDRGTVAHFPHENDFRRLPQRRPQAIGIIVKILAQLALIECPLKKWMNELNRIFQRHDVHRLRSEEHTSELQSLTNIVCHAPRSFLPDALPISIKAISTVARSRISPTRMTFGACRNAARRPLA